MDEFDYADDDDLFPQEDLDYGFGVADPVLDDEPLPEDDYVIPPSMMAPEDVDERPLPPLRQEQRPQQPAKPAPRRQGPYIFNFDVDNPRLSPAERAAERRALIYAQQATRGPKEDWELQAALEISQRMRSPDFTQADANRLQQMHAARAFVERQLAAGELSQREADELLGYINGGTVLLQARQAVDRARKQKLAEQQMMDQRAKMNALLNAERGINTEAVQRFLVTIDGVKYQLNKDGLLVPVDRRRGTSSSGTPTTDQLWKQAKTLAEIEAARKGDVASPAAAVEIYDRMQADMAERQRQEAEIQAAGGPDEYAAKGLLDQLDALIERGRLNPQETTARGAEQLTRQILEQYPNTKAAKELRERPRLIPRLQGPKPQPLTVGETFKTAEKIEARRRMIEAELRRRQDKARDRELMDRARSFGAGFAP
jgi:hypothetical protein